MKLGQLSTTTVFCVAPEDPVDRAFEMMEEHGIHHLPVLASDQVVGMVSDRDLLVAGMGKDSGDQNKLRRRAEKPLSVAQVMSQPVLTLSPDAPLRSATWLMIKHQIHAVPLVCNERLVGLVTESDLLRGFIVSCATSQFDDEAFFQVPVISRIRGKLTTVGPKSSLDDVVDVMCRKKIRHLPVVVSESLIGVVSDRDVRQALGRAAVLDAQSQNSGKLYLEPLTVFEIMSQAVKTIPSSATTQTAVEELLRSKIHCLPVVDNGKPLGIITDTDLLRAIGALDKQNSP